MSYEDGLLHRVQVLAKAAAVDDGRGGDAAEYSPVPGRESVPCRVTTAAGREVDQYGRREMVLSHKVFLPGDTRLTNLNRLVFVDPVNAEPRVLQVLAAADQQGLGRQYLAWCQEVAT